MRQAFIEALEHCNGHFRMGCNGYPDLIMYFPETGPARFQIYPRRCTRKHPRCPLLQTQCHAPCSLGRRRSNLLITNGRLGSLWRCSGRPVQSRGMSSGCTGSVSSACLGPAGWTVPSQWAVQFRNTRVGMSMVVPSRAHPGVSLAYPQADSLRPQCLSQFPPWLSGATDPPTWTQTPQAAKVARRELGHLGP